MVGEVGNPDTLSVYTYTVQLYTYDVLLFIVFEYYTFTTTVAQMNVLNECVRVHVLTHVPYPQQT